MSGRGKVETEVVENNVSKKSQGPNFFADVLKLLLLFFLVFILFLFFDTFNFACFHFPHTYIPSPRVFAPVPRMKQGSIDSSFKVCLVKCLTPKAEYSILYL